MGLRYLSSDSSGMKSNLKKSLQQGKQVVQELKSGSQQLISAVDGHTLSGAAYTAGKGLFSELIIPAINNVSKALDNVEQDLHKYESQEHIVSGEALLDEDSLMQERQIKRSLAESARSMSNMYEGFAKSIEHVPVLEMGAGMFKSHAKQMENVARSYQDEVKKIEEKIKKLHQFSEATRGLFESSLQELKSAMKAVTSLNAAVVDGKTGSYTMPNRVSDVNGYVKQSGYVVTGNVALLEGKASIKKYKNGTFWKSSVKSTISGKKTIKQVNGDVNRFKDVRSAKKIDRVLNGTGDIHAGLKGVGILGGAGAVADGASTYLDRKEKYGQISASIDGGVHTGSAVGGIYAGAYLGSLVPVPVLGTVAGAVSGYVVTSVANTLYDGFSHGTWNFDNFALW